MNLPGAPLGYKLKTDALDDQENFQLTEVTLTLETGLHAPLSVETEFKPEQELALTLLLQMVVLTVLGRLLKVKHVEKEIAQVCKQIFRFIH